MFSTKQKLHSLILFRRISGFEMLKTAKFINHDSWLSSTHRHKHTSTYFRGDTELHHVRSEVLRAVTVKSAFFRDVRPCSLVNVLTCLPIF
jgi:hypothetical protein